MLQSVGMPLSVILTISLIRASYLLAFTNYDRPIMMVEVLRRLVLVAAEYFRTPESFGIYRIVLLKPLLDLHGLRPL